MTKQMMRRICLASLGIWVMLTACSPTPDIHIEEYALQGRPEVPDLEVYFEVLTGDTQEILARRRSYRSIFHSSSTPVYVENELVVVETDLRLEGDHIHVYVGEEMVYEALLDGLNGNASIAPWSYDEHWVIEFKQLDEDGQVKGHILQDGQELNRIFGYGESFGFTILGGKPFYFYEKDDKVGISYNGRVLGQEYDQVLHHGCCNDSFLNPHYSLELGWFFARRGNQWYYVEVRVG
ncbi:MAG: hypothetical protein K8R89_00515 [Anaerolineae bacterium]|nr:hypothetical protein [Anaerolineae bacterium]